MAILSAVCGLAYPVLPIGWGALRSLVKTVAITSLAGVAALSGAWVLALALALSALGDFALSRPGDRAFLLGMAAFGAAHLVYVVLFAGLGELAVLASLPRVVAAFGVVLLAVLVALRLAKTAGAFAVPLRLYIGVIAAMGLAALSVPFGAGGGFIVVGAGVFMASDILIGHEKFAGLRFADLGLVIWGLYYAGQGMILLGVLAQG